MTGVCRRLPQSPWKDFGIVPVSGHDGFLPNPLQSFIQLHIAPVLRVMDRIQQGCDVPLLISEVIYACRQHINWVESREEDSWTEER
jgi:hypothetical protein